MSILSEKFNVTEDTIKSMIRLGVVSCSWNVSDEIEKMRSEGKSWDDIAFKTGMTARNCQYKLKEAEELKKAK